MATREMRQELPERRLSPRQSIRRVLLFCYAALLKRQKNAFAIRLAGHFGVHEKAEPIGRVVHYGRPLPGAACRISSLHYCEHLLTRHARVDIAVKRSVGAKTRINEPGIQSREKVSGGQKKHEGHDYQPSPDGAAADEPCC